MPLCSDNRSLGQYRPPVFSFMWAAVAATCCVLPALAQQATPDLTQASLEDLLNIKVISVSKTQQTLSRTASAVFVISADDIQRSGATNIPDILRMVPGLDVAQINANTWAVSARGLNGRFSNELLVLVDGRNVYTPTFGGVFWDVLDLPLEDIERIEVIRGPGATVWGANAVNGVVNIITKKAGNTHGGIVVAGGGNVTQGFGTVQYGNSLGRKTDYRIYTRYFNQTPFAGMSAASANDGWHVLRGGFRVDNNLTSKDAVFVEGNLYTGNEEDFSPFLPSITANLEQIQDNAALSGGFVASNWSHVISSHSDTALQLSFDRYKRDDFLGEQRNTLALDFQHHIEWGGRQNLIWGATYRYTDSDSTGTLAVSLNPANINSQLFGAFIQDEVAIIPNNLYVTAGTKLEHDYYAGFNWIPSGRIAWIPSSRHMLWAAVSEAQRTPSEIDAAVRLNFGQVAQAGGVPVVAALIGNPNSRNELMTAWELGYRTTASNRISLDVALYRNDYGDQQTTETTAPFLENSPPPTHLVLPTTYSNLMNGGAIGVEAAVNWKVTDRWTLSPAYAFERVRMHLEPQSQDDGAVLDAEGGNPAHSAQLRSHVDLFHHLGWDTSAFFVGRLASGPVPSYTRLDSQLEWKWTENLAMNIAGQNLLKAEHLEFVDDTGSVASSLVKRSAYAKLTWQF